MAFSQRRVGRSLALLVTGFLALSAFCLFTARPGDAAATWVVTFSASGTSPTAITASEGDVIVFSNELPLAPLTGVVVPVNVNYGGEQFSVGATPVSRTITSSTSFSGSYAVLGLLPLTYTSGTVTMTKAAPAPAPPPPPPPPPTGTGGGTPPTGSGGGTPPSTGGGTTVPGGTGPEVPVHKVHHPTIPAGDPGTVPGNSATGNSTTGGAVTGPGAAAGQTGAAGPMSGSTGPQTVVVAPRQHKAEAIDHKPARSLASTSAPSGVLGLIGLTGFVLLLGVGTALARAMLGGRSAATPSAA